MIKRNWKDYVIYGENIVKEYLIVESKAFFRAIDKMDIYIKKGEFICIMGKSGSGKTTLLNILSTIDALTMGQVYIFNTEVRNLSGHQLNDFRHKHLGFIFQNVNLLERSTIYKNIALPLIMANVKQKEIDERVNTICKQLEIEQLLNKYPRECSGGQLQRVVIARALINNPEVIFADEPTGNLDSKTSRSLMNLFQELNNNGKTIIMVTHDHYIASFSNRLFYLKDGRIINEIEKNELSQEEYFDQIVEISNE